jgi:hypothetical protein
VIQAEIKNGKTNPEIPGGVLKIEIEIQMIKKKRPLKRGLFLV